MARLPEENDLAQKWKMKKMQPQKQRLEAESEKKEQSKKQHEDLMQVLLQQAKQQQEQMGNYMQMFTSMYKQQSQITRKLLEKQNQAMPWFCTVQDECSFSAFSGICSGTYFLTVLYTCF